MTSIFFSVHISRPLLFKILVITKVLPLEDHLLQAKNSPMDSINQEVVADHFRKTDGCQEIAQLLLSRKKTIKKKFFYFAIHSPWMPQRHRLLDTSGTGSPKVGFV